MSVTERSATPLIQGRAVGIALLMPGRYSFKRLLNERRIYGGVHPSFTNFFDF